MIQDAAKKEEQNGETSIAQILKKGMNEEKE